MRQKALEFKLVREAKKAGGDRYEYSTKGSADHIVFYIPQLFSRPHGEPLGKLYFTISDEPGGAS